jgi:hypothetical protein
VLLECVHFILGNAHLTEMVSNLPARRYLGSSSGVAPRLVARAPADVTLPSCTPARTAPSRPYLA